LETKIGLEMARSGFCVNSERRHSGLGPGTMATGAINIATSGAAQFSAALMPAAHEKWPGHLYVFLPWLAPRAKESWWRQKGLIATRFE
jgi:hypothetical protein